MHFSTFPPSASDVQALFSSKTLSKARDILEDDLVDLLESSSSHLTAKVQGSEMEPYTTIISRDGDYSCTCPSEIQPCKHVAAVLLYARENEAETDLDLNSYLESLNEIQAKALLLELANQSDIRAVLLKRVLLQSAKAATPAVRKGVIKALKKILDDGKNIEHEGELGEAAFRELATLDASERSKEAWQIYDLLEGYEPNEYYDAYDESGDAYWEDRQSEWMALAMLHWGTAEAELGRAEDALEVILDLLENNHDMWQAALEVAQHTEDGVDALETWLGQQDPEKTYFLDKLRHDFMKRFANPKALEKHLRERLERPEHYWELVQFLLGQNREKEAMDTARTGVRRFVKAELKERDDFSPYWRVYREDEDPLMLMLALLKVQEPGFEWEEAQFVFRPDLGHYRFLKKQSEFAKARDRFLKTPMESLLKIDLLLEDDDRDALETLLKKRPTPEHALKLKHLFPGLCRDIFKKTSLEMLERGSREYYKEGANWAEEYMTLEEPDKFKLWLAELLETHKRRPALQDEFKHLKRKFL
jgi:hypothetical protein